MRIKGTSAELEARRRRAIGLLRQGLGNNEVARRVGASSSSVSRWAKAVRVGGVKALRSRPHPGRTPKLNPAKKRQLLALLIRGPLAAGYTTELWTCRRVADVIGRRFSVWYHPDHVWKILQALEWSSQKPERQARERDEQAIARWRRHDWPRIKKKRGV